MKKTEIDHRSRWSKFNWEIWRSDIGVSLLSLGARGLLIELLCLAHQGPPFGHVTHNGRALSMEELRALVGGGCTAQEVGGWLAELEQNGLLSRTEKGWIL